MWRERVRVCATLSVATIATLACRPAEERGCRGDAQCDEPRFEAIRAAYVSGASEIDLDGDGLADWFLGARAANGLPNADYVDLDHDGHYELAWETTDSLERLRIDANRDGIAELQASRERVSVEADLYRRVLVRDRDDDFIPDTRTTMLETGEGSLEIVRELDADEDGTFELIERSATTRVRPGDVAGTIGASCDAQAQELIEQAAAQAYEMALVCPYIDPMQSLAFATWFGKHGASFECGQLLDGDGASRWNRNTWEVWIAPSMFATAAARAALPALIFHELLHGPGVFEELPNHNQLGEYGGDQIYGCHYACFGHDPCHADICRGDKVCPGGKEPLCHPAGCDPRTLDCFEDCPERPCAVRSCYAVDGCAYAPAMTGSTCEGGVCCPRTGEALPACVPSEECCGAGDDRTVRAVDNMCCEDGTQASLCCGDTALADGNECCADDTQGRGCCGGTALREGNRCCADGKQAAQCCGPTALGPGQSCCGGSILTSGHQCCADGSQGEQCCGSTALAAGEACCGASSQTSSWPKVACAAGEVCLLCQPSDPKPHCVPAEYKCCYWTAIPGAAECCELDPATGTVLWCPRGHCSPDGCEL